MIDHADLNTTLMLKQQQTLLMSLLTPYIEATSSSVTPIHMWQLPPIFDCMLVIITLRRARASGQSVGNNLVAFWLVFLKSLQVSNSFRNKGINNLL